jgi:glutamyl-tRNA reductase
MHILVSGVRHRTAPIEIREKFALLEEEVAPALSLLKSFAAIEECAILTTCNRTEIYAVVKDTELGMDALQQFYKQFRGLEIGTYRHARFNLLHEDAVTHLFRVASGLDSLIIGEGQIMGQVKEALASAQREKCAGQMLDKLFKAALSVGKRVRTETGIADKDVSVSLAAFEFVKKHDLQLMNRRIALIGGGKMAEIMLSLFKQGMTPEQQANVVLVNRNPERLNELCTRYGFRGVAWEQLQEAVAHADLLFVATGAPHVVLGKADFEGQGPKTIIDIAVPRNVDPSVAELSEVQLFNTDNLAGVSGFSPEIQQRLVEQAQAILEEECMAFLQWTMTLPAVTAITRLREKVEIIRQAELASSSTAPHYAAVDAISRNLIQKILHDPTVRLKNARSPQHVSMQVSILTHLFNIDSMGIPAPGVDFTAIPSCPQLHD